MPCRRATVRPSVEALEPRLCPVLWDVAGVGTALTWAPAPDAPAAVPVYADPSLSAPERAALSRAEQALDSLGTGLTFVPGGPGSPVTVSDADLGPTPNGVGVLGTAAVSWAGAAGTLADGTALYRLTAAHVGMNSEAPWWAGPGPVPAGAPLYDYQSVLEHELGHAAGLGHVFDDPSNVMRPGFGFGQTTRAYSAGDRGSVFAVYGPAAAQPPTSGSGHPGGKRAADDLLGLGRRKAHRPKRHAKKRPGDSAPGPAPAPAPAVPTPLLGPRWPGTHPDVLFYLDPSLGADEVQAVLQAAATADAQFGGHVRLDITADRAAAQIVYEDAALDPTIAGETLYAPDASGRYFVSPVVVELNGATDRALGEPLPAVAAHETGHALGLAHSPDADDVMYAYLLGQAPVYSAADVAAVAEELYP